MRPETNEEPEITPVDEPQRRSSRVTSNDSGLEEDNFAPEPPPPPSDNSKAVPLTVPVEYPKYPEEDEEPDGTRTHSVPSPVFVGSKTENPTGHNKEASTVQENAESDIVHCVDGEGEEVTDLGGTIEADDGLGMGNENEEWNNEDTEAATSAQDIPSLPNDNEEDTLGSGSLVIEGTAIEQSNQSTPPVEPKPLTPVEQTDDGKPPLQRNLTYKREKSASNRPKSAQSRPQSSFQRPASSNSVRLISSNVMKADGLIISEQRPASQASSKSVQSLVEPIPENEDVQVRTNPTENEQKLSDKPSSANSTQSMSAIAARSASETSIKSEPRELPPVEQEPVQQIQSSRPSSQDSLKPKTKDEKDEKTKTPEPVSSRPGSKASRTSASGVTNPEPVAEPAQTSSRAPSFASERPVSKISLASRRVGSAESQRSAGSLKVPDLDTAETSGTNMTHAERSASSLEELEMLQHVMEVTLEGKPGGGDEADCTEEAETWEPESEESSKTPTPVALEESQNLGEGQQEKPTEIDQKLASEEDAQSEMGLDDVRTNKLLDTFSTKNLEASMKMDDTGNEADDDARFKNEVAKSPQEDQEEHINM